MQNRFQAHISHLNDEFQIKDATLLQYYRLVRNIMQSSFDRVPIQHIPSGENVQADALSKLQVLNLTTYIVPPTTDVICTINKEHLPQHGHTNKWTTPYI